MCGRAHQAHPTPCAGAGCGSHGRPERAVRLWRRRYYQYAGGAGPPCLAAPIRVYRTASVPRFPRHSARTCQWICDGGSLCCGDGKRQELHRQTEILAESVVSGVHASFQAQPAAPCKSTPPHIYVYIYIYTFFTTYIYDTPYHISPSLIIVASFC
jgi:hypothetical protein